MKKKVMSLEQKIDDKSVVVGILGLGYVGLPLAREFVMAGVQVAGFDIDASKVKKLNSGKSILKTVPDAEVRAMVQSKKFRATADMAEIRKVDAVLICVPTPLTAASRICSTLRSVAARLPNTCKRGNSSRWKARRIRARRGN